MHTDPQLYKCRKTLLHNFTNKSEKRVQYRNKTKGYRNTKEPKWRGTCVWHRYADLAAGRRVAPGLLDSEVPEKDMK